MMYFHKDSKLFCILHQIRLSWNLLLLLKPGPMGWLFGRLVPSRVEDATRKQSNFVFSFRTPQTTNNDNKSRRSRSTDIHFLEIRHISSVEEHSIRVTGAWKQSSL